MQEIPKRAVIDEAATIADAFRHLNENKLRIVFALDKHQRVVGCLTDGDIRRQLLVKDDLSVPIAGFLNRNFAWADIDAPRERVLKLLDHGVHTVPILDEGRRLVRLCTREDFHLQEEAEVFSRARAPARISFGGGGSDLTHYFFEMGGMVISATIGKYAYASLRRRSDSLVRLYSYDLDRTVQADRLSDVKFDGSLDLLKSVVHLINPPYGFELEVGSDFPMGSGLGGSASVAVAVIGCFNEFRSDPWTRHQIAEMAFQSERLKLSIPGGWQDQYAAAFGGVNFMEFSADENLIVPLRLESWVLRELEASIVLCNTKISHNSGMIHSDQKRKMQTSTEAQAAIEQQKRLTLEIRRLLLRGDIHGYGRILHEAWCAKRVTGNLVSNPELDQIYDHARRNGALGGKVLGAGGGGYFMFFVPPFGRYNLCRALSQIGYDSERVSFDDTGLISWKIRVKEEMMDTCAHAGCGSGEPSTKERDLQRE